MFAEAETCYFLWRRRLKAFRLTKCHQVIRSLRLSLHQPSKLFSVILLTSKLLAVCTGPGMSGEGTWPGFMTSSRGVLSPWTSLQPCVSSCQALGVRETGIANSGGGLARSAKIIEAMVELWNGKGEAIFLYNQSQAAGQKEGDIYPCRRSRCTR